MDLQRRHKSTKEILNFAHFCDDAIVCIKFSRPLKKRLQDLKPTGCNICRAAFYLSKMNLLLCKENGMFSAFPDCPSDRELRTRIRELGKNPEAMSDLVKTFKSDLPEIKLFRLLLRQKGMEIYFGRERAEHLARRLGLKRMPSDEEIKPAALLYAVTLLEAEKEEGEE
jgi:hypothetical protein